MRNKTPKHKPNSADTLLKTSKKAQVELTEQQLGKVSGGLGKLRFGGDTETGSGGGFLSTVGHVLGVRKMGD
jgi:hypothetical protein